MHLLETVVLAIVQGAAEFLPISSSGHLVIVEACFEAAGRALPGHTALVGLNIALHVGTLGSVIVVYHARLLALLISERSVIPKLIVGTLPAVAVGFTLRAFLPEWLSSPLLAGAMLPVTGVLLLWGARTAPGETRYQDISFAQAWWIGCWQALAILPGISRSGSTITAGLRLGLRREDAATFSFLLAVPVISGAAVLEGLSLWKDLRAGADSSGGLSMATVAIGVLVSFVVGLVALRWLLKWLGEGKLHYFAGWCIGVGLLVLGWQIFG